MVVYWRMIYMSLSYIISTFSEGSVCYNNISSVVMTLLPCWPTSSMNHLSREGCIRWLFKYSNFGISEYCFIYTYTPGKVHPIWTNCKQNSNSLLKAYAQVKLTCGSYNILQRIRAKQFPSCVRYVGNLNRVRHCSTSFFNVLHCIQWAFYRRNTWIGSKDEELACTTRTVMSPG